MIINKILSDSVVFYWDFIKYGAIMANNMSESKHVEEFCRNLLCNLLSGKYQCWVGVNDEKTQVHGIAITKIEKDIGNIPKLLIESLYVYKTTSQREKLQFVDTIKGFGETLGCESIILFTSNSSIADIAKSFGFNEPRKIFELSIGG